MDIILRWRWVGNQQGVLDTKEGITYAFVKQIRTGRIYKEKSVVLEGDLVPAEVRRLGV